MNITNQGRRPSDAPLKPSPEQENASQGLKHSAIDEPADETYWCPSYEHAGRQQGDRGGGDVADQSRAFLRAASQIDTGRSPRADRETSRICETESLAEWAKAGNCPLVPEAEFDVLPLVSNETSEHEVRFRENDNRAVKRTWAGVFGQIPIPKDGKLDRVNATPSEYLRRQALQVAVFGSDIKLEGVSISDKPSMVLFEPPGQPSFVISQEWFQKEDAPTLTEIAERLRGDGFLPVPKSYFGWYRPQDGVVIVDAKPDNFVKTEAGIIPLDLQMAIFSMDEAAAAGLSDFALAPETSRVKE